MGQTTVPSTGEFTGFLNHQQYVCRQSYTSGGLIHYYSGWSTSPTNVQATTIKRSNSPPALFRANQCFNGFNIYLNKALNHETSYFWEGQFFAPRACQSWSRSSLALSYLSSSTYGNRQPNGIRLKTLLSRIT